MKIAVIDMGTNTFHLILVEVSYEGYRITHRERIAVKIGQGGISNGHITPDAEQRAIEAVREYQKRTQDHGIDQIYATATSAIRNARNGLDLLDKIKKATGITARIISGREEAEYIYFGVTSALRVGKDPALIMDIGGGSIEFIIGNDEEIFWLQSFEIGGQRMIDRFHLNDPITSNEISALEQYLFEHLQELFEACAKYQPETIIGSSGTFDTMSDILQRKKGQALDDEMTELPFEMAEFDAIYQEIISKTRAERLDIPGMIPMRVDMIVVALVLIKYVLDSFGLKELRISAYALKEGVLLKTIDSLKKEKVLRPDSI